MIINGPWLLLAKPIKKMLNSKIREHGVSHGLSEVGYDIRIKQEIFFSPPNMKDLVYYLGQINNPDIERSFILAQIAEAFHGYTRVINEDGTSVVTIGRTALASSIEEFDLPNNLWGELRNKSTHARRFFDATIGTDMEPGWKGFLTIEIIFHGNEPISILSGSGIAKAVFHEIKNPVKYPENSKYQNQADKPIPAILE